MAKYDARMNMMRNGELQPQNTDYDPNADLQAHTASHKRTAAPSETYLSKDQLTSLRKVQNERIEVRSLRFESALRLLLTWISYRRRAR